MVSAAGARALRLRCNFAGPLIERASWDHEVRLDLTRWRGLRFDFLCADASPVSRLSLHLRSGNGWYAATFEAPDGPGFSEVTVDKMDTRVEGRPAGWGRIDALRISAWRGQAAETEFFIANLALRGVDAPLVLVRGEATAGTPPGEVAAAGAIAGSMARMLDRLGLPFTVLAYLDVTDERLAGRRVALLPYDPALPDEAAEALVRFADGGGRILAFYALHPALARRLGLGGGEHVPAARPGRLSSIRAAGGVVPGLPEQVRQASWNIRRTTAVEGGSRVAAVWHDAAGASTGEAAILVSEAGVFVTHVLLGDDPAGKERLLLALLGHLRPEVWPQAVRNRIGALGPVRSLRGARGCRGAPW